jgi:hypothetical protein
MVSGVLFRVGADLLPEIIITVILLYYYHDHNHYYYYCN